VKEQLADESQKSAGGELVEWRGDTVFGGRWQGRGGGLGERNERWARKVGVLRGDAGLRIGTCKLVDRGDGLRGQSSWFREDNAM